MENAIESTRTAGDLMNPHEKLHAHHEKLIGTILQLADLTVENPPDASLLLSYCGEYLLPHADSEEMTLYAASTIRNLCRIWSSSTSNSNTCLG